MLDARALRDLADRLQAGALGTVGVELGEGLAAWLQKGGAFDAALGLPFGKGRRWRIEAAVAERNRGLRDACREALRYKDLTEAAEWLSDRLSAYRSGDWVADRLLTSNPYPDGSVRAGLWVALKARDCPLKTATLAEIIGGERSD